MIRLAMTNASGESTTATGSRYGRSASGTVRRNAPSDSGAPAYISTLAEVTSPTSDFQLGNGSRNSKPAPNAKIRLTHGIPRLSTQPKICGKYRFLARPYPTREVEVW